MSMFKRAKDAGEGANVMYKEPAAPIFKCAIDAHKESIDNFRILVLNKISHAIDNGQTSVQINVDAVSTNVIKIIRSELEAVGYKYSSTGGNLCGWSMRVSW